jgi:23S rRNA A1618 N6-methylase RlmF
MHPRNPYSSPLNIAQLASQFPDLCDHIISRSSNGRVIYDWHAPGATYAITRALLQRDFQLDWQQPPHFLCPTVPGRLNYLLWLEDLVLQDVAAAPASVCIADIGTGASAIFPLLGARRFGWSFVALDSNSEALEHARSNIERNGLQHLISLHLVPPHGDVALQLSSLPTVTHTMCNPPFFAASSSHAWRLRAREANDRSMMPCAAVDPELFTEGGEVEFMGKIIEQCAASPCRNRIKWFTCMVGIKADLALLKRKCAAAGATQIRTTTFFQGQTLRWGIAWSFVPTQPQPAKRALEDTGFGTLPSSTCALDLPCSKRSSATGTSLQTD